jgi:large conductance mechanosensitive channel
MLKGFKDFLLRGNIVDLAVAVVIGTAFTALVSSFSTNLISPLIARVGGGGPEDGLYVKLGESEETWLKVGDFLSSVITFLITAGVVYFFVVVPMKRLMTHLKPQEETVAEVAGGIDEQTSLLREIRDSLAGTRPAPTERGQPGHPPTP